MMRMLQVSVHSADVKGVICVYSLEVPARDKSDLEEDPIVIRLRKVRLFSVVFSLADDSLTINRQAVHLMTVYRMVVLRFIALK